ncbi:major facilitator superfamily domain-containing protein [Lasiosphaeria hispida]|uniref:Major facilitator superfamily domain-containing protein n=1 Tax=Lasiosphaeria hispida TaxID=260671 RepID=A0AAJ0HL68_9PEZI|nr:major facilitator superfamily domain-containing protein [Lasiosphaeria hispida]
MSATKESPSDFNLARQQAVSEAHKSPAASDIQNERRLRTKIDLHIVPIVSILYLFSFIDRANIGNAKIAGLDKDLGMTGYDYNVIVSAFYIGYILFEVPAILLCKWLGPGWFLPATSLLFGICSVGTAFVTTVPQACVIRFLLGIFEAGMMPGTTYYLSRWYKRSELTFRLSLYLVTAPLAGAFGGLLASGILRLSHFGGLRSWRMIFAVEGILTIGLSLVALLTLTDRPETARWLTAEEKTLAVTRVRSERVTAQVLLDTMTVRKFVRGVANPVTLSVGIVFLFDAITVQAIAFFLPTIVKTIYPEYDTVQQQLYTAPPYVFGAFMVVFLSYLSWRIDRRQIFFIISAPVVMAGYVMFLASKEQRVRYGATFLVASSFTLGALTNSQVSANVISDTSRSGAIAFNSMCAHLGGLVGTWAFLPWDGPHYPIGNGLNLATSGMILIISSLTLFWMKWDNRARDKRAAEARDADESLGLTQQEVEDLDWRHPAFRWRP